MCNVNSTTTEPLSCRDWNTYAAETLALMAELQAEYPRLSDRDAHACASAFVDGEFEQFAADWDAMVALFADSQAVVDNPTGASFTPVAEPEQHPALTGNAYDMSILPPDPDDYPPEGQAHPAIERARRKAQYKLLQGCRILFDTQGYAFVPSNTRGDIIHEVSPSGQCSCEAGRNGRFCWHVAAVDLLLETGQAAA